jgi:hypothetical protein
VLQALERQLERLMQLLPDTPGRLGWAASISGNYGPQQYEQHMLPFHREYIPQLEAARKLCSVHAHASNLSCFAEPIRQSGFHVVEAFTPPPVGDLSLADARSAWGPDTVIWVNLPETIFLLGREQTYEYTADLLKSDARSGRLVLGLTEMGTWGALDDDTDRLFKEGLRAVMDAIDDYGAC